MASNFLDRLFFNYRTILDGLIAKPGRSNLAFVGATVTDDPANDRTIVDAGGGGTPTIIFEPGGGSSGNVFATWEELIAAAPMHSRPLVVMFSARYTTPTIPAGDWRSALGENVLFVGSPYSTTGSKTTVNVDVGALLTSPVGYRDIFITASATTFPDAPIQTIPNGFEITLDNAILAGCLYNIRSVAQHPWIIMSRSSRIADASTVPVIRCRGVNVRGVSGVSRVDSGTIDGSETIYMDVHSGGADYRNLADANVSVGDQLSLDPRGINSFGPTANRPDVSTSSLVGFRYFDTDLGKPIWWNSSDWVDAAGTVV